ncbi:MAG TPA: zf-HC2 domain-containing protein [Planctomycetota bacterium]|nr:zf-HC2 domain-containing protein [Planctomycetota bacterium]
MRSDTSQWLGTPLNPSCERAHLLITRHIDGELAPGDASDLRMHLTTCPACRRSLESQAALSNELADSLKALWSNGTPLKKKFFGVRELWNRLWRKLRGALPQVALCAALVACVLLIATKANAPSMGGADETSVPPASHRPVSVGDAAANRQNTATTLPMSKPQSRGAKLPDDDPASACAPESNATQTGAEESNNVALEIDGADESLVQKTSAENTVAPTVVAPLPRLNEPRPQGSGPRAEETLAQLAPSPALKPLAGVGMTYSILTESGAREEGHITILGDVLNGKAVVRLESGAGAVIDAAQSNLDTLSPARRAVARRLLEECLEPGHRKRMEEAVRKLGE